GVVKRKDVRVTEAGDDADLAQEPLRAQGGGDVRREHLDRHTAAVLPIHREIDRAHAAAAELALDRVPAPKRLGTACEGVRQRWPSLNGDGAKMRPGVTGRQPAERVLDDHPAVHAIEYD